MTDSNRALFSRLPGWFLPGCLLFAAWALAIRQLDLEWTINPEYQYGWIVPLLALLLWHQAWLHRPEPGTRCMTRALPWLVVLLILLAVPMRIIEEANPDWRPLNDYFTFQAILVTAFMVDYAGGWPWLKHFAFALLFPLVAVPWPSGIETEVIQDLQRLVASIDTSAAAWLGWGAFQSGNLIVLSKGVVGVNEACSGIRSLQSSLMFSLFVGEYFRLTISRRWFLIGFALLLAFALSVMRAFILIAAMEWNGSDALSAFHDPAGFGVALISLLLLWILSSYLAPPETTATNTSRPVATAGIFQFPPRWTVLLLVAWLGSEILNQAWYAWHEKDSVPSPLWTLEWPPPRPDFKDEKIADEVKVDLHYNEGRHGAWREEDDWEIYFFTWKPSRAAAGLAGFHRPDICMPASGFILKKQYDTEILTVRGLSLPVNRYIFQDPLHGELYYVFQAITNDRVSRDVIDVAPGQLGRLQAAWNGVRNPGQRSLLVINRGAEDMDQAQAGFESLLKDSLVISNQAEASTP